MCLCEPSLSLSSLLPSLPPAWLNTFSVPTPSRLCWANPWGQLGGPRGSWRQRNAREGPQVQGPTGNHMELRANLSTLTPNSGSPVTGEGHLPLPEAEGHHGLEEGELASPPSSPHPPLPPCRDLGPFLLTLNAQRTGKGALPTGLPVGAGSLESNCLGSNPDLTTS